MMRASKLVNRVAASWCGVCCAICLAWPTAAAAQQSVKQVISFLLTNRSVSTDDFVRDEQAAASTRDAISQFLVTELGTLPINSSASGFAYRFNPTLGTTERSSDSFGPFLVQRALTTGRHQFTFGMSYQQAKFDRIDGRSLGDGRLVATASELDGESQPFDVETITLLLDTNTTTFSAHWGWTDRLETSAALPLVRLSLSGQRVDTYRGRAATQATVAAAASGPGDLVVRTKYSLIGSGATGLALGGDVQFPTGDEENLLGTGEATIAPRVMYSFERTRFAVHGDAAYVFFGASGELDYGAAATVVGSQRFTVVGELAGRRLASSGSLTDVREPHPTLPSVDTIRLTSVDQPTQRLIAVLGVKWNVAATFLVSASVMRPLTSAGLHTGWVPTLTVEYSVGR
jgi:hypothetical protein